MMFRMFCVVEDGRAYVMKRNSRRKKSYGDPYDASGTFLNPTGESPIGRECCAVVQPP